MPILSVLWKFKYWIAIAVLSLLWLGQIAYTNHLSGKLKEAEAVCDERVSKAIKPYEDAIDQAQIEKATIMQTWSDKYIKVEQNAIKKIQDANAAARSAELANNGLSKQLSEANKRCPQLPIKPSLSTPLPTVSYSKLAQQNIEAWQKKQMATQLMSKD